MYEYPPILTGDALQQIAALRDYLARRVREDHADPAPLSPGAGAGDFPREGEQTPPAPGSGSAKPRSGGYDPAASAALRSLIVKTADAVERHVDELRTELHEDYLALSDFGSYQEQIETRIVQTARETVESYDYDARITAAEGGIDGLQEALTELNGQIRRGLITDPETGETVLGIAVSQELRFTGTTVTEGGLTYWELSPGQTLGLYTSTGWQFWIGGSKRGWFDSRDGKLHVSQIQVESRLQHGEDWLVTTAGGYGIRYIGT